VSGVSESLGFGMLTRLAVNSVSITNGKCPAKVNDPNLPMQPIVNDATSITYTYSVYWLEEKEVNWGNR